MASPCLTATTYKVGQYPLHDLSLSRIVKPALPNQALSLEPWVKPQPDLTPRPKIHHQESTYATASHQRNLPSTHPHIHSHTTPSFDTTHTHQHAPARMRHLRRRRHGRPRPHPVRDHALCEADLNGWFQRATENELYFPPKCCGVSITPGEYEPYLDAEVLRAYQAKARGSTPY